MAEQPNLEEIRDTLVELAKAAGKMITSARPSTSNMLDTKKNSADLVTETDKAVEIFVSTTLNTKYPNYAFIGEETYQPGIKVGPEPTFIVDPIDGTTNFIHGHPYVAISLGFSLNRTPTVGVVYNPFTGHMYHSIHGQGAFLTTALPAGSPTPEATRRLPLRTPERLKLSEALIGVEWGSERDGNNWRVKSETFAKLAEAPAESQGTSRSKGGMVHGLRSFGGAALNMCSVAAGELDGYWEGGCWAWDVCAAWVIVVEAGGHVLGANPGEWDIGLDARRYLAVRGGEEGNSHEWKEFVEAVWSCVQGRLEY